MEKEKVLEIEITKINEEWSAGVITYQDTKILKRKVFKDTELKFGSIHFPEYFWSTNELCIRGEEECLDLRPFLILNKYVPKLLEKVDKINEKYGKVKRWRAEKGENYYFVSSLFKSEREIQIDSYYDNERFEVGNYFRMKEEAEIYAEKFRRVLEERK